METGILGIIKLEKNLLYEKSTAAVVMREKIWMIHSLVWVMFVVILYANVPCLYAVEGLII